MNLKKQSKQANKQKTLQASKNWFNNWNGTQAYTADGWLCLKSLVKIHYSQWPLSILLSLKWNEFYEIVNICVNPKLHDYELIKKANILEYKKSLNSRKILTVYSIEFLPLLLKSYRNFASASISDSHDSLPNFIPWEFILWIILV